LLDHVALHTRCSCDTMSPLRCTAWLSHATSPTAQMYLKVISKNISMFLY
jgi:hypothetical protein